MATGQDRYRPRVCVWELTLRCNLRCLHCGATAGSARPDELTTAEALRVADELAALKTREVTLMGGEIFLRPDWLAVAEALRAGDVQLVVFTNCTLITPERIAQLRALEPRTIGTSLDGGCAAFLLRSDRTAPLSQDIDDLASRRCQLAQFFS